MNRAEEIFRNIKAKKQRNLLIKVKACAKQNSIDGLITIDQKEYIKLSIKSQPIGGKANKAIVELMSKELDLPKSTIDIKAGKASSHKILRFSI